MGHFALTVTNKMEVAALKAAHKEHREHAASVQVLRDRAAQFAKQADDLEARCADCNAIAEEVLRSAGKLTAARTAGDTQSDFLDACSHFTEEEDGTVTIEWGARPEPEEEPTG